MINNANKFQPKGKLRKTAGTITAPEMSGLRMVLNLVDPEAKFDSTLHKTLAKRWKDVHQAAKSWYVNRENFKIGEVKSVAVQSDVWVLNAVADVTVPASLDSCFKKIGAMAKYEKASVHVTESLTQLDGFDKMVQEHLFDNGVNVYVYPDPV